MRGVLVAALVLALGSLTAARYLDSPGWILALFGVGLGVGLALAMVVGLVGRRLWTIWTPAAAAALGAAAAAGRSALVHRVAEDPLARVQIHFGAILMACTTVVWGAVALVWGTRGLADALQGSAGRSRRQRWVAGGASAAAVSLALYCLAPLWLLLGLRINHLTVLGLFGLAATAWGAGQAYRLVHRRWLQR